MPRLFAPLRPPDSRPARVIRPHIEPGRRVLAVSDIHGNLPFLKGALEAARFTPGDVLVIVGDLLEKGTESLNTLRYVMGLQRTHTVYVVCGNCDYIDQCFLSGPGLDKKLWPILHQFWRERSVLIQIGIEAGMVPQAPEELPAFRAALLSRFPAETGFLLNMPHILEAGNFIFVHGGVPREDRLEELDAYDCMKNDDFLGQGHSFQKWVVVGHWPVTLYDPAIQRSAPLIDQDRRIASIDGGCVLKLDGQLNVLLIPDICGDEMNCVWYDGLPTALALDPQQPSPDPLNIRWADSGVEVLREEGDCTLIRHLSSGRAVWVPRDFVSVWRDGKTHTEDATDYALPVSPGDRLSLVRQTRRGLLAKREGITGWYFGRVKYDQE